MRKKKDEKEDKHAEMLLVYVSVRGKGHWLFFQTALSLLWAFVGLLLCDVAFVAFFYYVSASVCIICVWTGVHGEESERRDEKDKMRGY